MIYQGFQLTLCKICANLFGGFSLTSPQPTPSPTLEMRLIARLRLRPEQQKTFLKDRIRTFFALKWNHQLNLGGGRNAETDCSFLLLLLMGCNHSSATKEDTQSSEKAFLKEFASRYNESIDNLSEMENMPTLPEKIDLEGDIRKENNKDTNTQIVVSETDSSDNGFLNYMLNINYDRKKIHRISYASFRNN